MTDLAVRIRQDFPVLARKIDGKELVYLDSAATSLRPGAVLAAMMQFDSEVGANVHRGGHLLGDEASDLFEAARAHVAGYFNVPATDLVFTGSTTQSLNLVALGLNPQPGANVVTDTSQHHAAYLPWFGRAEVRFVSARADGAVDADELMSRVDDRTVAALLSQGSNITGRRFQLAPLISRLRERGVLSIVDGAQGGAHGPIDVAALGCDYFACSGHKLLGPTGIGILTGRRGALAALGQPVRGGGAVRRVGLDGAVARDLPHALEPGTPPIASAIGLGAAAQYWGALEPHLLHAHEATLARHLLARATALDGLSVLGPDDPAERLPLVSLVSHDAAVDLEKVARLLSDRHAVMARAGHLCCHPFVESIGLGSVLRFSAHVYTTVDEVDVAFDALTAIWRTLHRSDGPKTRAAQP